MAANIIHSTTYGEKLSKTLVAFSPDVHLWTGMNLDAKVDVSVLKADDAGRCARLKRLVLNHTRIGSLGVERLSSALAHLPRLQVIPTPYTLSTEP